MSYVVHIIESPSEDDFLASRSEGRVLMEALTHAGLPVAMSTVISRNALTKVVVGIALKAKALSMEGKPITPILHLSMHGSENEIGLTSGERLTWKQLAPLVGTVHSMSGGMWLVMSTCKGFSSSRMAYHQEAPFSVMIGSSEDINWNDTVAVFTAFYHHVIRHEGSAQSGVSIMNAILGTTVFGQTTGAAAQDAWTWLRNLQEQAVSGEHLIQLMEQTLGPRNTWPVDLSMLDGLDLGNLDPRLVSL
ncbi:MAG: hypothetical protein R3B89_20340 [Polyangiaceae bacterium]